MAKKQKESDLDILLHTQEDRRLLSHVPSQQHERTSVDRRGRLESRERVRRRVRNPALAEHRGIRYLAKYRVKVICKGRGLRKRRFYAYSEDISTTGMLMHVKNARQKEWLEDAKKIKMKFRIIPGTMPEGYEMRVKMKATLVNVRQREEDGYLCGMEFTKSLMHYAYKRKGRNLVYISAISLVLLAISIILMRAESIAYFQFNRLIYLYSIVTASYLLSRYLFGMLYRPTPINEDFKPPVSIIIPCFNEEKWIQRTILSCLNQSYPPDRLEVIIVDDCSNDGSVAKIDELLQRLATQAGGDALLKRVSFIRQEVNQGKREAMARGVRISKHDLVVFVDSDSFLDPYAVVNLVQPFQDPKMGGVSGRTDVANTYTNFVTKMQSVRYYISFRIMKAAEGYFDAVTCLSGPLSCYRKEVMLENLKPWLEQRFLGQRATFGDDRSMTNFILRKHRTGYQDTAICSTIVPNTHKMFLKQQMRWKRSWLRESSIASTFMWKKEPLMALSFYFGFLIPILAPAIVLYNLVYIPVVYGFFPRTFLFGLFAMAMLMSVTQLLMRRSRTWIYGLYYCIYHVLILMWQMPIAWVTFWKSTWGTRMTPQDIAASQRRWGHRQTT